MKQQAAQKRAAVAEHKRRASATNTHERQAREAAARLLDGEVEVSRLLTAAPAARRVDLRYHASRGESLPAALRDWLEPGFDADLSAVRIHHDALAAEIAALEGSRAFASGRHLFFGAGEYQPSQATGRRLIAHEVAHVLQQTARRQNDGRLIVTDAQGSADVQRDPPPQPSVTFDLFETTYRDYATQHEAPDVLESVETVLTEVQTALGTATVLSPTAGATNEFGALERRVRNGDFNAEPAFARTTLLDALKIAGRFPGAAYLLQRDALLKTSAPMDAFRLWLDTTEGYKIDYFAGAFAQIPEINRRYPYNYLEAIWRYLLRPASVPSGSGQFESMSREYETNYRAAVGTRFLYDNERVRGAYHYLGVLNTELQTTLQGIERQVGDLQPGARRAAASHAMLALARSWATHQLAVYRDLSPRVVEVAQKAIDFWGRARSVAAEVARAAEVLMSAAPSPVAPTTTPGTPVATPAAPPSVQFPQPPPEILTDRVFSRFVTATKDGLQVVLGGPSLALLDERAYAAALTALRQTLNTQRTALSEHLPDLYTRQQIADQARFDRAIWLGVAQVFIDNLVLTLDEYDAARESQLATLYGALPDVRLRHRWMVASGGYILGVMVGDAALKAPMLRVLQADDMGRSYFAFTGEWEQDRVDLDRLETDFPENALLQGYGLRIPQFRRIFFLLRQQTLVTLLRQMLSQSENDLSPQTYGIMQRAIRQARETVPYPVRYKATRFVLRWHPSDETVPERRDLFALITNHPRIRELEQLATAVSAEWVIAVPNTRPSQAFAWVLPNFNLVRNYIATIPSLRQFIDQQLTGDITPENVLDLLEQLHEMSSNTADNPDLAAQLRFALDEASRDISGETERTIAERDPLFQRALVHDRRIIVAEAGRLLRTYGDDDDITNYSLPSYAFELIDRFRSQLVAAYPDRGVDRDAATALQIQQQMENDANVRHRELHMTALVLSLTDDLRHAFIRSSVLVGERVERRYDLITDVFGPLSLALRVSGEAQIEERLRPYLHASESPTTLLSKRPDLLNLRERLLTVIHEIQREHGLQSNAGLTEVMEAGSSSGLAVGEDAPSFTIDGVTYQVTQVHTPFIFHPAYGRHTDAYQPSILTDLNGTPISRTTPVRLLDVVFNQGEHPVTITSLLTPQDDSQELLLEQLSHAVTMKLIIQGLEATAAIIEGASRLIMEGVGIIFPPAQAAIIAVDFIKFLATELPTIREDLIRTPTIVVQAVQEFLSPDRRDEMLTRLWEYLLFTGDLPFAERIQARLMGGGQGGRSRRGRPGRGGRFARLVSFVRRTGARILDAFFRLRNRMRSSFIRMHRMVERRPLLHRFLRAIPGIIEVGSMVRMSDIESAREVLGDLVDGNGPSTIAAHMRETLDEFFDGLNGLEVPAEILPMNLVLDMVIERFLMALGWRGKALNLALETTNLRQILADKLADELKSQGLDPNILWQELLQGELQAMLEQSRTELIAAINTVFNELFGSLVQVDATNLPSLQVATDSEAADLSSEPEVEPLLDDDRDEEQDEADDAPRRPPRIVAAGGVPLPTTTRLRYERAFGHDFTHVRLHYDQRADRIARHYHAQALTSGSHIFLSAKLPPSSPRAESVMKHELAHVLQQTGSRPLNLDQKPDPTLGQPGRGLRLDSRREAGATRMAQQASTSRVNNDPVSVEEADELGGLLPAIASTVARKLLENLGSERLSESFQHQIDTLRSIPSEISNDRRGEFNSAVRAAQTIWDGTKAKLLLTSAVTNPMHHGPQTFNNATARRAISYYFSHSFEMPSQRLRALTFYSFSIRGNRLSLNPGVFKQNLANYISEATGFDLAIDPNGSTIDFVKIMYLDLGEVHGNSRVYQTMKQETNDRITRPGGRGPVLGVPRAFTDIEWAKIREQIAGGATDVPIWDDNEYRLGDTFIRKMREMLDAVAGGSVDTWIDYTTTTSVSNATFGGLRVGTHGQLTGDPTRDVTLEPASGAGAGSMAQGARAGRQSHHIPQYLLVEYFQNLPTSATKIARADGSRKLFPPGFVQSGNTATGFRGAGKHIDFAKLDPGSTGDRGRGLPAISLAAKTHQKGQLHINAAATWGDFTSASPRIEITGTPTQGIRLDQMFYGFLRGRMNPTPPADPLRILQVANRAPGTHATAVYEAIRETYMWMFRGMMGALRRTLNKDVSDTEHWEALSYRTFALNRPETQTTTGVLKPEYIPHNTQLAAVSNAIETKNREIMADWYRG